MHKIATITTIIALTLSFTACNKNNTETKNKLASAKVAQKRLSSTVAKRNERIMQLSQEVKVLKAKVLKSKKDNTHLRQVIVQKEKEIASLKQKNHALKVQMLTMNKKLKKQTKRARYWHHKANRAEDDLATEELISEQMLDMYKESKKQKKVLKKKLNHCKTAVGMCSDLILELPTK